MNPEPSPTITRYRLHYRKTDSLRYTGNLDIHKIWERAIRRAGLPLAYSLGFSKQPKINQAAPLPLGFTSQAEILDIWLDQPLSGDFIIEQINRHIPNGISIKSIDTVDLRETAIQNQVTHSTYRVTLLDPVPLDDLSKTIENALLMVSILRVRRNKEYDLRPLIQELKLDEPDEDGLPVILMHLTAQTSATGRPDEVVAALGYDPFLARYHRIDITLMK